MVNRHKLKDRKTTWEKFAHTKVLLWQKWIINNKNPNTYFLDYSDLLNDTANRLREIIEFINPSDPVNTQSINIILKKKDVYFKNSIDSFKYYDPVFFRKMRLLIKQELLFLETFR